MIVVLSPAKTLDMESPVVDLLNKRKFLEPALIAQSRKLISVLKKFSSADLSKLMKVSDKIAGLNYDRFRSFKTPLQLKISRPAILAFRGDVYRNMTTHSYSEADFAYAEDHLRILSGLYGLLRPLDLILAYRLEMGTKLKTSTGENLYQFWADRITEELNRALEHEGSGMVANLASQEYFRSVRPEKLRARIISPVFKEKRNGQYKIIALNAKRARGMMADYIIKKRVKTKANILKFAADGYRYDSQLSQEDSPVFIRSSVH